VNRRRLERLGLEISLLGFGAFKIGRNQGIKYAAGYELPDDVAVNRLLNGVLDLGISLIDTAPAYGTSEERIGQALAHRQREFVVSTKVGETFSHGQSVYDFSREAIAASVHRSLKRLRRERLDLVFLHSPGNDVELMETTQAVPTLQDLKGQGLVHGIGLSGKTVAGARAALEWADAIMVEYHCEDVSHAEIIQSAHALGVGVIVKKGLASGRLPPETAIPFVLANPAVTSLVSGGLSHEHLRQNVEAASGQMESSRGA
jgi:aryl-alcohol dehydrogenase-like predicted oxidoreductase